MSLLNNFLLGFGAGKAQGGGSTPCPEPTGTKEISLTANGTTTHDVAGYADAEVTVNVPVGYTANELYDMALPTGTFTMPVDTILEENGIKKRKGITKISFPNAGYVTYSAFESMSALTDVDLPVANGVGGNAFLNCTALVNIVLPNCHKIFNQSFKGCSKLVGADFGGTVPEDAAVGLSSTSTFDGCTKLQHLVIRSTKMFVLGNINVFNNTRFASGKAGGILYVPQSLVSAYQGASNWSTILGYTNNQIKSIESTATDPTAPVDLTTHYIDGTLIPT